MMNCLRGAVAALMLTPAIGAAQDLEAGLLYLPTRVLAAQGNAAARFNLGVIYAQGRGVAQDYTEAARLFRLAAEQGDTSGQRNLGLMYDRGHGVAQDYAEAVRWYRLAAAQGSASGQSNLGFMYDAGRGVAQNYPEAVRWYKLAAEQGEATAHSNLGLMYSQGRGVAQDYASAHMWFNIATANGYDRARERRDELARKMTPADISEAQRRARVCMASGYQDCDWTKSSTQSRVKSLADHCAGDLTPARRFGPFRACHNPFLAPRCPPIALGFCDLRASFDGSRPGAAAALKPEGATPEIAQTLRWVHPRNLGPPEADWNLLSGGDHWRTVQQLSKCGTENALETFILRCHQHEA